MVDGSKGAARSQQVMTACKLRAPHLTSKRNVVERLARSPITTASGAPELSSAYDLAVGLPESFIPAPSSGPRLSSKCSGVAILCHSFTPATSDASGRLLLVQGPSPSKQHP